MLEKGDRVKLTKLAKQRGIGRSTRPERLKGIVISVRPYARLLSVLRDHTKYPSLYAAEFWEPDSDIKEAEAAPEPSDDR